MSFSSIFFAVVPARWRHASSSSSSIGVDVEAQTISGTCAPYVLPTEPEEARVVPARPRPRTRHATAAITSLTSSTTVADVNAVDDFLGGVHESHRHDSARPSSSSSNPYSVLPPPPPYVDIELPAYSLEPIDEEPPTLAKYIFVFGFLFPLFWILGAVILLYPLTLPREFQVKPSKSREELELCERIIRAAEVKWAKRCAWALFTLIVLASFIGAVIAVVVVKIYP